MQSSLPPPEVAVSSVFEPAASVSEVAPAADDVATGLGALDRSGAFSLATLDDTPAAPPLSDGTLSASIGPPPPGVARPARRGPELSRAIDLFAPPELAVAEPLLELAEDELAHRARRRASAPPPERSAALSSPPPLDRPPGSAPGAALGRGPMPAPPLGPPEHASRQALDRWPLPSRASGPPDPPELSRTPDATPHEWPVPSLEGAVPPVGPRIAGSPGARTGATIGAWPSWLASAQVRFAVGVLLAILLGFIPAHLVAAVRERSAFAAIDRKVSAAQAEADTPDGYAALDQLRADQLDAKRSAQRSIALVSLLIWAIAGGGLAYVWFRRVPWDRLASRELAPREPG
jgi:hypothetical protein